MICALSGSDLKAYILEATRTWHIQHEFSDCRCDKVCIWYNDNFLTRECSKIKSKQSPPPPRGTSYCRVCGWVCATDLGRFFISKNPEQALNLNFFPEQALISKFYSRIGSFLTICSQTLKMPVAFLKNDRSNPNFLFKKSAYLLALSVCLSV